MSRRAQCPACRDSGAPLADGSCRRCAGRRLVADLLAVVPAGSLPVRVAAVADIARDALVATALAATGGSRRDAAALLKVAEERVTEALRRFPWLARVYPGKRGRKPAPTRLAASPAANTVNAPACEVCGATHEITAADRIGDRGEQVDAAEAMMVAHYRLAIEATSARPFNVRGGRAR